MSLFNERSVARKEGVHPALVAVAQRARELSDLPFEITEGVRDEARQRELFNAGKSQTMNSRHLKGRALDFHILNPDGTANWDFAQYQRTSEAWKRASQELGVPIVWGGDWKSLRDGPHIQLADDWSGEGWDNRLVQAGATMTDANNDPMQEAIRREVERRGLTASGGSPAASRETPINPMQDAARRELERRRAAQAGTSEPSQARSGGLLDAFTQGVTFGFGDEATALESAILGREPGGGTLELGNYEKPFWERYRAALDEERGQQAEFREDNRATATIAEIGGAVASAIVTGGSSLLGTATTTAGRVTRAGIGGATGGAVYGAGDAEGGILDVAEGARTGAITGAIGGVAADRAFAAAGKLLGAVWPKRAAYIVNGKLTEKGRAYLKENGVDPDMVSKRFLTAWEERVKQATGATDDAGRLAQADEFGIPLTRGQASGNERAIAFENAARNNARGEPARAAVAAVDDQASAAVRGTINTQAAAMGGADDALEAAESVGGAFRDARTAGQARVRAAYEAAENTDAVIDLRAFPDLAESAVDAVRTVTFSPTAKAKSAISGLQELVETATQGPRLGGVVDAGEQTRIGVSFLAVEQYRKKLNRMIDTATPEEMAELRQVKGALDTWLDGVMDSALISGSDDALKAIKAARAEHAAFSRLFGGRVAKSDVDRLFKRMADENVTPQEVANWLWGSTKVGAPGLTVRAADRLKKVLPEEAWGSVRSGAWRRLTQSSAEDGTPLGPQALSSRIKTFLTGDGRELAARLYSERERTQMARFAKALDLLVPPGTTTNRGQSGYEVSRAVGDMMQALGASMGMATGGLEAGIGGLLIGQAGRQGMSAARGIGVAATRAPVRPSTAVQRGAAVVGGVTAAKDQTETERRTGPR